MKRLLAAAAFALLAISPIFSGDPPCQAPQGGCGQCYHWVGDPSCQCEIDCGSFCVGQNWGSQCLCFMMNCINPDEPGGEVECVEAFFDCMEDEPPPPHGCENECDNPPMDCRNCCMCAQGPMPGDLPDQWEYWRQVNECTAECKAGW